MKILEKIKNYFSKETVSNTANDVCTDVAVKVIDDATAGLKKVNASLKSEINSLKNENKQLRDTIYVLQKKIDALENTGFTYSSSSTYTLPKQEPIRSYKPRKNNRYDRKRYYKKEEKYDNDNPKFEKITRAKRKKSNRDFIRSEDIPKPGSHDRIVLHG